MRSAAPENPCTADRAKPKEKRQRAPLPEAASSKRIVIVSKRMSMLLPKSWRLGLARVWFHLSSSPRTCFPQHAPGGTYAPLCRLRIDHGPLGNGGALPG